jgi:hypothetical protein
VRPRTGDIVAARGWCGRLSGEERYRAASLCAVGSIAAEALGQAQRAAVELLLAAQAPVVGMAVESQQSLQKQRAHKQTGEPTRAALP